MLRLLTDENFNQNIVRGLTRRLRHLDILSVRDVGLMSQPDPVILDWAASENRAIMTHDIKTMVSDAGQLVAKGLPMAGVILVPDQLAIGRALADLELTVTCYSQSDMRDRITYLPF